MSIRTECPRASCAAAILPFCQAVTLYRVDPGDQSPQWKEEHSIEKGASVCQLLIKLNIGARIADQTYERHIVMFLCKSWIFSQKNHEQLGWDAITGGVDGQA